MARTEHALIGIFRTLLLPLAFTCVATGFGGDVASAQALPDSLRDDATSWAERAVARQRQGMLDEASRLFRRAADVSDTDSERALHLSNAAATAEQAGHGAEAAVLLEAAGELCLKEDTDDRVAAFVLANWAQLRNSEARWEAAEAIAVRAAERARAAGEANTESRAWRLAADSRRLLGRFPAAQRALDAAERAGPGPEEALEIGFVAGLLDLDAGRPGPALDRLTQVAGDAAAAKNRRLEFRARLAEAEAATAVGRRTKADGAANRAQELAQGPRERADVEQRRAYSARARGDAAAAARRITACLAHTDEWLSIAPNDEEQSARRRAARGYVELALEIWFGPERTSADPTTFGPTLAWIRRVRGIDGDVAPHAEPEDVTVVWFWGADRVTGITVTAAGGPQPFDAGDPEELREWILSFRSLLADPSRTRERETVGRQLVERLLPRRPTSSRGRLLVEPDGLLAALPFAALPGAAGPLGVEFAIHHASAAPPPRPADASTSGETRILADPTLPLDARSLGALPGARAEAGAIATTGPQSVVLLGDQAAESRAVASPAPQILHLAAHTEAEPPAILLAPGDEHDGRLTVSEIRRLDDAPTIVVLSGCESSLTDVTGRSSVGQLTNAFLGAGAQTVVGALWKVEDRGLGKFMAALHERLHAGDRPSEALRRARAAMLLSARHELLDPFLWGAFISTGRDRPIDVAPVLPPAPTQDFRGAGLGLLAAFATLALLASALIAQRRREEKNAPGGTGGAV